MVLGEGDEETWEVRISLPSPRPLCLGGRKWKVRYQVGQAGMAIQGACRSSQVQWNSWPTQYNSYRQCIQRMNENAGWFFPTLQCPPWLLVHFRVVHCLLLQCPDSVRIQACLSTWWNFNEQHCQETGQSYGLGCLIIQFWAGVVL